MNKYKHLLICIPLSNNDTLVNKLSKIISKKYDWNFLIKYNKVND